MFLCSSIRHIRAQFADMEESFRGSLKCRSMQSLREGEKMTYLLESFKVCELNMFCKYLNGEPFDGYSSLIQTMFWNLIPEQRPFTIHTLDHRELKFGRKWVYALRQNYDESLVSILKRNTDCIDEA